VALSSVASFVMRTLTRSQMLRWKTLPTIREYKLMAKKWIQSAIKHPGSFTKAAHQHHMSPSQFANSGNLTAHQAKQAALYKTLRGFSKQSEGK